MNLQNKLIQLREERKAILAANFYNLETLQAVIGGASDAGASIILQLSESSINYIGLEMAAKMARTALAQSGVRMASPGPWEQFRACETLPGCRFRFGYD